MLKFKDYEYKRPDMEKVEEEIMYLIEEFEKANSSKEQNEIIGKINGIREEVESMSNLVYIRHSINTLDEYYEKEQEFLDENMPLYENLISRYMKALVNSKFRNELE